MKEEDQRNIQQKQMLINRLYKSKNTQNISKPPPKNQDDTKLLFYQTKKKSFREKDEDPRLKILPRITPGKHSQKEEESALNVSIPTARRTSRGNSFNNFDKEPPSASRKLSVKKPQVLQPLKVEPVSPKKNSKESNEIYNTQVATFFKMVRQKKLTADEFIYMIRKHPNDHYNMEVVPYSQIIKNKVEDYYTFSCKGVSKFVSSKPVEFITVEEWFEEVKAFNQICQYNFFITFRKWKSLKKWMKVISTQKIKSISKVLEQKMFLTNTMYQKILINHKTLCADLENVSFVNFTARDPISKEDLIIKRTENSKQFNLTLTAFSNKMHENSNSGIDVILKTLRNKIKKQDSKKEDVLGFPENMNYGDRSMMRHQLIRIIRLSYLIEFIATETLGKCYIKNIQEVFDYIEKPIIEQGEYQPVMKPLKYEKEKKEGEKKPEPKKAPKFSNEPLFKIKFTFDRNHPIKQIIQDFDEETLPNIYQFDLNFWDLKQMRRFKNPEQMITPIPKEEELTDILISFFKESGIQRGIKNWRNSLDIYIDSLEQWDEVVGGRVRDRENASQYVDPSFWLKEFSIMSELIFRIQNAMRSSYNHINKYICEFETYLQMQKRQQMTDYSDLAEKKYESINEMFLNLVKINEIITSSLEQNLEQLQQVSIYEVDSAAFKRQVISAQEENVNRLTKFIEKHLQKLSDDCETFFNDSIQKLSIPLIGLDDFVKEKEYLEQINKKMPEITEKVTLMGMLPSLLPNLKNNTLKKKIDKTIIQSSQNNTLLAQMEGLCQSSVDKFKKEYKELQKKLNKQFEDMLTEVQDKKWLTEAGKDIIQYKPKIQKVQNQVRKMKEYEESLDIAGDGDFDNLYTLKMAFDLRYSLWKGLQDFEVFKADLEKKKLSQIEVKNTQQIVEKYVKTVNQCQRNLSDNPIVPRLKKVVWLFKDSLPAVNALKSQFLEEEHIEQISAILGEPFSQTDENLTLGKLFEMNINEKSADLIQISTKALQERQLKETLSQVQSSLNDTDMVIKAYKDSYILGQVDELTIILDEALANVNNTLANRYVKAIRPRAQKNSQDIQLIMEIVDKWVEAQRKWMYLQNIFVAPDIKTQMPMESKDFQTCDKFIRGHVKRLLVGPKIIKLAKFPKLLEKFNETTQSLQKIEKKLEQYLESKRKEFPRFYFLSNDELLQILSRAGNLEMIEQHLGKCFEALVKLYMADGKPTTDTNIIEGILSPQRQKIKLKTAVIAKGNVEKWLRDLEKEMYEAVRRIIASGMERSFDGTYKNKIQWIKNEPAQVVAVASQIIWTSNTEHSIEDSNIESNFEGIVKQLRQLTLIVRGQIPDILRKVIVALITIEVHNRDIVNDLMKNQCQSVSDFLWQQQLRYYLGSDERTTHKQVTSELQYGYQYLGATSRLVITPLTDRCWITITSALANKLGASPAGPAGTGKTQSTKDLAKALGRLCIVFNCSDQITANMMNKLFKGLAQQGAWACLDEFNRIDIEVLSVIAQQLLVIRMALLRRNSSDPFEFDGDKIPMMPNYGCFITMNPGYAGRTQLPDNLKSLFRPVSMMIPDYAMIAEIMLFAEGFENASILSKKMVQLYKLSSQQLSQQDHYDFGMRAVKSLLVMAGSLKRAEPDLEEDSILIKAMKFANIPKFVKADIPLFTALITDLFPSSEVPPPLVSKLEQIIPSELQKAKLQPYKPFEQKIIQLYDTFNVRFGVMLVGQAGSGKSCCYKMLAQASTSMKDNYKDPSFNTTTFKIMNPKCITMGEMYGQVDPYTQEWADGLASTIIRDVNTPKIDDPEWDPNQRYWVVFDGPVDALWIENMNTVLDDNMTLCLANSERIKLRHQLRMLFEVQDLAVASPATVSRCGMVYLSFDNLHWSLYVQSWLQKYFENKEYQDIVMGLFNKSLEKGFKKKKNLYEPFPTTLIQVATNICSILQSMLPKIKLNPDQMDISTKVLTYHFIYAFIWGLGGGISFTNSQEISRIIEQCFSDITFPRAECIFDHFVNPQTQQGFINWSTKVPTFEFDKDAQFFDLLVPTIDTIKYSNIIEQMLEIEKPLILTGESGVGKSVLVGNLLAQLKERKKISTIFLNFSAQTKSKEVQLAIESKLVKKGKTLFGAKTGQKIAIFIDDVNMPALEFYGAQPCIELLRQLGDLGGFYDRAKLFFKQIVDTTMIPVCAPPGGGRNQLSFRYLRQLLPIMFPTPSSNTAFKIFNSLLAPKCSYSQPIVFTTLAVFEKISKQLLPTPSKFQYIYNMRDIGKVIQNIGKGKEQLIVKLFIHEIRRVFADRMIQEDYEWFKVVVTEAYKRYFSNLSFLTEETFTVLFTDILKLDSGTSIYQEITDRKKLYHLLQGKQEDYNFSSNDQLDLVFFDEAVQQILRICRILRQPRGNAMLIGVGGSGKQSLSKLSSFIMNCERYQIQLVKNYNSEAFRGDLQKIAKITGGEMKKLSFIFTDVQIAYESFLQDINNILNTGEVPNLFVKKEDFEEVYNLVRPHAVKKKIQDSPQPLWNYFINSIRENLHVILCMSPVGEQLRVRCRKFPSLINCCSLDWFPNWPKEALIEVANKFFKDIQLPEEKIREGLTEMCMNVSVDVTELCEKYMRELRRKVYTTPKSYLDHIKLYKSLLAIKKDQIESIKRKLSFGLEKLYATNEIVAKLQEQMTVLKPQLAQQSIKTEQFLKQLAIDTQEASKVEAVVQQQAELVNGEQQEVKLIADDAQAELSKAIPALKAAADALKKLNKNDITQIKGFANPPPAVAMVLEAVCILLGEKSDWDGAKKVMMEMGFLDRLREYNKDALAEKDNLLKKLRVVSRKPEFDVEQIGKKSVACKSLAMWVKAMDNYAKISKQVEPKKKKVAELTAVLDVKNKQLKVKQDQLQKVKDKVQKLQKQCDETLALKKKLEQDMIKTNNRLISAEKLTVLLQEEGIRWKEQIENIAQDLLKVIGDVFLSAATISYLGPFTGAYRQPIINLWKQKFEGLSIPFSENYTLASTLQTPLTIREWTLEGLSNDALSIDNGVIATKCERWPLFIDPQGEAFKWIKKHEESHNLNIINFGQTHYLKSIQTAIQSGYSILLENVEEKLEPAIDSVLQKQIYEEDNRRLIRVGDKKIDYDDKFKLFITTKLSNPNYLPEIYIKVTVINFSITFEGLKDQLLGDVVKFELPEIQKQRDEVVISISSGKKSLKEAQDNILTLLSESTGMILDNIELIKTLEESKKNSAIIKKNLEQTTAIEETINESRSKYIPISIRGTVLYFVISDLALIDPMYQFSLTYFKKLFLTAIQNSQPANEIEKRLDILLDEITRLMYTDVCRGLFESHKRIYSFMMCTSIRRQKGQINFADWNLLIRGSIKPSTIPNPDPNFFSQQNWDYLCSVTETCQEAKDLTSNLKSNLAAWKTAINSPNFIEAQLPEGFQQIKNFTKLMIIKGLAAEKIMKEFSNYVSKEMGAFYDEIKTTTIDQMFKTLDYKTPMIFILSTGADPTSSLLKYAQDKGKQLSVISLGQGQGKKAERLINRAKMEGAWVLLTNCHLAKSWMSQLQKIVLAFGEDYNGSEHFRLILTSMPASYFPVPVLQSGSKLTLEPPRGLKANLKKSFVELNDDFFKDCDHKNQDWHKLVFSLSFFHAIIQQRRKFGPLGFNIRYEFNDSDISISYATLSMFLNSVGAEERVPWEAMLYMTGHINYGGRVTDDWDRVCLLSILKKYYNQTVLDKQKYDLSSSKIYFVPPYGNHKSYVEYIQSLPNFQDPQVFGMHQNANITYQNQESNKIMETILSIQPRVSSAAGGKTPDQIVTEMAEQFMEQVPNLLIEAQGNQQHFVTNEEGHMHSLSIVLLQEMAKFNNLIRTVNKTLNELKKAIQGLAVMSQDLDQMYLAFQNNSLPGIWRKVSYASLKPLASWFKDFIERVQFLRLWLEDQCPFTYWMSGFYFPQGFLTGVLQTHSRQYKIPIDTLSFKFKVLNIEKDKLTAGPENGVYVNGLFLDGARWDPSQETLIDQTLGKLYFPMPIIHFLPIQNYVRKPENYRCPCYKTSNRAGVLSTTGQSTNFILPVDLPTKNAPDFWTLRGTALLCQLDD